MAKGSVNGSWSISSKSETAYTLSCSGSYTFKDWYLWGVRVTCYINGSQVATNAGYTTSKYQTTASCSGTKSITRTHSDQSIYCEVKSWGEEVNGIGALGESDSTGGWITVPAKSSYTVSYNANGGTGAPGNQTKWYGENLTLSSTKPTRTGYTFAGWNTAANGNGTNYSAGGTYSSNSGVTLYAKWTANTWTVKYDANGGTGAPANQTKTYGVDLALSSTKPTRKDYNFLGWGTSASSTTVAYAAGGKYTTNVAITLYAIWELAWIAPNITNLEVTRSDSSGNITEDGTCAKITFNWSIDKLYDLSEISIKYKLSTDIEWTTVTVEGSGRSGSVSQIIGSNTLSTEYVYDIQVTVADANGGTTLNRQIASMAYTIDFKAGGKGVAFGKPSAVDNLIDSAFNMSTDGNMNVNGNMNINGTITVKGATDFRKTVDIREGIVDSRTVPTTQTYSAVTRAYDINGDYIGVNQIQHTTADVLAFQHYVRRKIGDNYVYNEINPQIDGEGNRSYKISDGKAFRDALGVGKTLWSGTVSKGGSITVSDLPKYTVFACRIQDWTTWLLGAKLIRQDTGAGSIRFFAQYAYTATCSEAYSVSFTVGSGGQTLTYTNGSVFALYSSGEISHSTNINITNIIGLV